jgi:hypothetical protein
MTSGEANTRMLEAWAQVFSLPSPDGVEVSRRLIALSNETDELQRLIESLPHLNPRIYLACIPAIKTAVDPIYLSSQRAGVITPHITPEVLVRLEFCSEELERAYAEERLADADLSEIETLTRELFEFVRNSNVDASLAIALLEALERARIAISLYQIHGAKGLKASLQGLLGLVFTEQEAIKREKTKNLEVVTKLGELLDKLDTFTSKALKLKKALTGPVTFLLSLVMKDKSEGSESNLEALPDDIIET